VDAQDPYFTYTRYNYDTLRVKEGTTLILPSVEQVQALQTINLVSSRPEWMNWTIGIEKGIWGFIEGIGIGFAEAAVDMVTGIWDMISGIISGKLFTDMIEMVGDLYEKGLEGVWEMVKGMWTQGEESFKAAWNNPNPEEKWKFFGKIVGMILFEVVLAILTAGAGLALSAAAKSSALVAKLPKLVKVIDALTPDLKKVPDVDRDRVVKKGVDADVRTKKVDEIKAEQPDYVKKTDVDAEADARKRGESELDKNDPEFEDKLEAFVQAVVITEAADLVDEPVSALVLTLDKLIGSRFKVDFKYLRTGVDEFDVLMNPKVKKKYTGPESGESKKYNKGSGYQQSTNKDIASEMRSRLIVDIEDFLSKFNPVSIKGLGSARPQITLTSGTNKRGLRHILERHHPDYFPGNKGDLFPTGTSIDEIVQAINDVYSNGSRVTKNINDAMQTFNKVITINKETHLYKLVVDSKSGDVITFFKQTQI
jgi:hypothetical protein